MIDLGDIPRHRPPVRLGRRGLLAGALAVATLGPAGGCSIRKNPEPLKVGVLHSLTGTMAISERSLIDAEMLAIEELNDRGGVLGRRVRAVVADGRSDWPTFAACARRLITEDRVHVIFGCWTSASRKTVIPILERHGHLMFYPVQYEGLESSASVVYLGAAPNQQILPAVKWSLENQGRRFFLVGSDYVFPRAANAVIGDEVTYLGGTVVGEEYVLLGSSDLDRVVERVDRTRPDVILNTINGDSNLAFFRTLRAAGIGSEDIPVISFSIAEDELRHLDPADLAGHYAAWNYFQSVGGARNRGFVRRFRQRYGPDRVTDDPIASAYMGVHLWAKAVEQAGTPAVPQVRRALRYQSFDGPEGRVFIDGVNQHTWRATRIGRIRADGDFDVVWTSDALIHPVPYPVHRTRNAWHGLLRDLKASWDGEWANPGEGGRS